MKSRRLLSGIATCGLLAGSLFGCARGDEPAASPSSTSDGPAKVSAGHEDAPKSETTESKATQVIFETPTGETVATVEVVSTPALIQRGLMYREHLPPESGMLFVFGGERIRTFWMKNTLIPLDMIFVQTDMAVAGVVANAVPQTLDTRSVRKPSQYVVEMNAGWAAAHGVEAGTKVRFEHLPPIDHPPL